MTGQGQNLDQLVLSMHRAAEAARCPLAKPLLLNVVQTMSITDVKNMQGVRRLAMRSGAAVAARRRHPAHYASAIYSIICRMDSHVG